VIARVDWRRTERGVLRAEGVAIYPPGSLAADRYVVLVRDGATGFNCASEAEAIAQCEAIADKALLKAMAPEMLDVALRYVYGQLHHSVPAPPALEAERLHGALKFIDHLRAERGEVRHAAA
jgi:HAMP domain-containing protein